MRSKALRIGAFYLVVIGLWALVARAEVWSPFLFPAPQSVLRSLVRNLESGLLLEALQFSMLRLVVGYGLSIAIGLALGA
jgi:NitT/TauT family transport system permease protein